MDLKIVNLATGEVVKTKNADNIFEITSPSDVYLNLESKDLVSSEVKGEDLVLYLEDGSKILVKNFYAEYASGAESRIILSDDVLDVPPQFAPMVSGLIAGGFALAASAGGPEVLAGNAALVKIEAYNNGDGTTPAALTVADYVDAGVTGVSADNLAAVNAQVLAAATGDADTVPEVQTLVLAGNAALAKIEAYNNGDGTTPAALTVADYADAGVTGVSADNLAAVNAQVLAAATGDADAGPEVQTLVLAGNAALAKIEAYNNGDGTTPAALTVADYADAGVTGVSDFNIIKVNAQVLAATTGGADTCPEVQALVNAVQAIPGFKINGAEAFDFSGNTVSLAGDVNGDGLDDLIIGAYNTSDVNTQTGTSYVVFGKAGGSTVDLSSIEAGTGDGFAINGYDAYDHSGWVTRSAGDVNGDGFDDIIVGAYQTDPQNRSSAGSAYVVFGKADRTAVELSSIEAGVGGFEIQGASSGDRLGTTVASAGDVNGDGLDDLIVGARYAAPGNNTDAGSAYVVFGKIGTQTVDIDTIERGQGSGFAMNGVNIADWNGVSVKSAGDVNGDGLDDLIVGANRADPNGNEKAGSTYVVYGKTDNAAINLLTIENGTGPGFVINGASLGDESGNSVSSAGDINGDGLDDLLVGAYRTSANGNFEAGAAYVVYGKANQTAVELSDIEAGTGPGFMINGANAGDRAGYAVSAGGDVNGDGLADMIISAYQAAPNGASGAGAAYVVFGKADQTAVDLSNIEAENGGGFAIYGYEPNGEFGTYVSSGGDVNGDGLDDLIIGAPYAAPNDDPNNLAAAGVSYVVFGKTDGVAVDLGAGFLENSSSIGLIKSGYTAGDDSIVSDTSSEIILGGDGNDTLTGGGGSDVIKGGSGDDLIIVNEDNLNHLASSGPIDGLLSVFDGGGGQDTLRIDGADITLDLTLLSEHRIRDIEIFDLTGSGNNILKFSIADILDLDTDQNILKVTGDAGDSVEALGYTDSGIDQTQDGRTFDVYSATGVVSEVWIEQVLQVI